MLENKIPYSLDNPSERFGDIHNWYKLEEKVWKFTYKRNLIENLSNLIH